MKNYNNYTPEDFLKDEHFRQWVLSQGPDESFFGEQFPENTNNLMLARALLLSLHNLQAPADQPAKEKIWTQVRDSLEELPSPPETASSSRWAFRWWQLAAMLLLVSGLAWKIRSTFTEVPLEYEKQITRAETSLKENVNTTKTPQTIVLKDGSTVKLKPGSKLSYSDFSKDKRVVYLNGEGFFDVTKDSKKPFWVYAGPIIVRVIGTRFNVVSTTGKAKSNVSVTSGKVMVYAPGKTGNAKEEGAIYLYPNQKAVFDATTQVFEKRLVEQPIQLAESENANTFFYTNTSVSHILDDLETAYGVSIRRDKTMFDSCKVTAPLGDLPLFRKLDIICQTVGATYEVFGTEIIISGGNCNL
ncbi:MAG: FecR domain-containing protein [Spirosomataceae bacterium]